MTRRHDSLYFGHMLDTAAKACQMVRGLDREDYNSDETLRLALTHLVQVIGEAAQRVSPEGRAGHPEIPWREITGTRHKIVHDYLAVDEDVIWQVVTLDLPDLVATLQRIVPASE